MSPFFSQLRSFLLPTGLCHLCRQSHRDQHAICTACSDLFVLLGPACYYCAEPLVDAQPLICGACCSKRPAIDRVITLYRFEEPLRSLLHAFKYESALYLSSFLTALMLAATPKDYRSDCLIPVPLHPKKLQQRGFNQAAVLALALSRALSIPCDLYRCRKIIATLPQARLTAQQRRQNLKQAFEVYALPYQHVTLIDDLYTTGTTANELARTLKKQGVEQVDIWCCARASKSL